MIVHENRVFPFIGLSQTPSPVTETSRRFSMGTSHFTACMQARLSRLPGAATPQNDAAAQQMKHGNRRSIWAFPGVVKHNRRAIFSRLF
jgi:hypothetical protein